MPMESDGLAGQLEEMLRAVRQASDSLRAANDRHTHTDDLVQRLETRLDRIEHLIDGNGAMGLKERLGHVERTAKDAFEIAKGNKKKLTADGEAAKEADGIRWRAIGEVATALAAAVALAMQLFT